MTSDNSSDNINLTPVSSPTEIEYSIEGTVVDSTNPNKNNPRS
jgi:hypothetical protein